MPDSPCRLTTTWATKDAACHSRWEYGQGPASTRQLSKVPRAKMLGPTLLLVSALTMARPYACRPTGVSGLTAP